MVEVADLKAKVKVDGHSALSILEKLDKSLENIGGSLNKIEGNFQKVSKRGAESMGFLSHSMAYAFGGLIKDSVQWMVDKLGELSLNLEKMKFGTGINILSLQRMKAVLEQNNVSFDEFLGALSRVQDMQARMKYGQLSQDELFAFGQLGINPRQYKTAEDLLNAIGNSLLKIQNVGDRNFLANKLKISPEVLRGLTVSGWYDEFAALTDAEQQKMSEYAKNAKAVGQEISSTWSKFVAKFISEDGIKVEEWALETLSEFNKIVDTSDNMGEAFDRLGEKISKVFDITVEDTKFVKGLKFLVGAFGSVLENLIYKPLYKSGKALGALYSYLTRKDVTWQNVVDAFNDDVAPISPNSNGLAGAVQNSYGGNTMSTINRTTNVYANISTTGTVDGESIKELEQNEVGRVCYAMGGEG